MRLRAPSPPPGLAEPPQGIAVLEPAHQQRRRRRRRLAALVVVVTVLVALAAGWLLGFSDTTRVAGVEVVGARDGLADDVESAAAVERGVPLVGVDLASIAAAIEAVPDVADVAVTRAWPATVRVTVTPRTPVAVLASPAAPAGTTAPAVGETWSLLDAEGVAFGSVTAGDRLLRSLPVVRAVDTGREDGPTPTAAAAAVVASLPVGLLEQVAVVEAFSPFEVRLGLRDGRVVVWGAAELAEEKAAVLAGLMTQDAARYDVSVPTRPTLLP